MKPEYLYRRLLFAWFKQNQRDFPWRHRSDPYQVLVAEVMLQRTRGENAVGVYGEFLERFPDAAALAGATVEEIQRIIKPLGLRKRAVILKRLGEAVTAAGGVPCKPEELLRFPGVGRYAAHSVQVYARRRNLPVVDWVVARVLRRYFGLDGTARPNSDERLWELAAALAKPGRARELWFATFDFGAAVCKPRPLCPVCDLSRSCAYYVRVQGLSKQDSSLSSAH